MSEIMDSVQIESSERQISGLCGAQEFYSRRETITRQACQGRTWETEATLVLAKRYSQREEVGQQTNVLQHCGSFRHEDAL